MSDDSHEHDRGQIVFRVYGLDPDIFEDLCHVEGGEMNENGYDHDVAEASTLCMQVLQERFDWAKDITGVAMGYTHE